MDSRPDRVLGIKGALLAIGLLFILPASSPAASFRLTSETLVRGFERNDGLVAPAYEYLRADLGEREREGLSFHLYGWGRAAVDDGNFFADDTAGELLYGYLEYRRAEGNLELRLGRMHLFQGVANEAVDGLAIAGNLSPNLILSAYGGQPVALETTAGRSGDAVWGGRLAHRLPARHELGISYKQVENDGTTAEETAGVDLYLLLPRGGALSGFSTWNLETEGWGEHFLELRWALAGYRLRPFFERYAFEDFFGTGANSAGPFRFLDETGETLTVFGGEVLKSLDSTWEAGLRVKLYDYDRREDASQFISLLATRPGEGLSQAGGEIGLMTGDAAENRYLLGRAFFYRERLPARLPLGFLTGDLVYVVYDEEIFGRDSALFLSLGTGRKFLDQTLEVRLSGDYSRDPFLDEDLRGMVTARYVFAK